MASAPVAGQSTRALDMFLCWTGHHPVAPITITGLSWVALEVLVVGEHNAVGSSTTGSHIEKQIPFV